MIKDYVRIARIDHWFKNIFMLPGIGLGILMTDPVLSNALWNASIAFLSTCLIASANYVINEWLDAEFDRHHPVKQMRPSASGRIQAKYVYLEYALLIASGLGLALLLSSLFFALSVFLLVMGVLYNVRPFRTKERVYLDVLSESINNPIRLLLGWSAVVTYVVLPPSSIILTYWMGGAFLMAVKRYAEYRFIGDAEKAALYRRSFKYYNEQTLLLSSLFYALSSSFFLGIFLVKYRIEFLLSFPLFALLFVWYLAIGMKPHSPTQNPEKLYRETGFIAYLIFLCLVIAGLFVVDLPWLEVFVEKQEF